MSRKLIIFLLFAIEVISAQELQCDFVTHRDGYNCEIKLSFNETATSVAGNHLVNKTDSDVRVLFAPIKNQLTAIPGGACSLFLNLYKFDIFGKNITELSTSVFEKCVNVTQVIIMYTKIVELDENIFSDLINVWKISIIENQLASLPKDIFKNNQKLKYLDLSYNKLQTIPTIFPANLTTLKLFNNVCIDKSFNSSAYFDIIRENCWNETSTGDENVLEKFNELKDSITLNSEKIEEIETNMVMKYFHFTFTTNKLDADLKKALVEVKDQGDKLDSLEEKKRVLANIIDEINANITEIQKNISEHVEDDSVDKKLEQLTSKDAELEINYNTLENCIIVLTVIVILLMLIFVTVLVIFKFMRRDNRESLLMNVF